MGIRKTCPREVNLPCDEVWQFSPLYSYPPLAFDPLFHPPVISRITFQPTDLIEQPPYWAF